MLSLITWNIQWGVGVDGHVDLERIASDCHRLADADIVCFQEVASGFKNLRGHDGSDQFQALAQLFPSHQAFEGLTIDWPITGNEGQRRECFGNMILSRLPVLQVIRHSLPWTAAGGESMQRGALEIVVKCNETPIRIVTTHLEWSSSQAREPQIAALRALHHDACTRALNPPQTGKGPYATKAQTDKMILCGDFNMRPNDPLLKHLQNPFENNEIPRLVDIWTSQHGARPHPYSMCLHDQSHEPARCLDYIFTSETLIPTVISIDYDQMSKASDHQPVVVRLG
jgi:endonuclease/exonuclease/phosphatase family metal-dependent hydrolase